MRDLDRPGPGAPAMLIAEISANHDRDLDQALALVNLAADAGWDCIKLQTYDADSLTIRSDHPSHRIDPVWGHDRLYDLYAAAGMPMEFHEPLFARARERGLVPFTSIYDPRDLDFIEALDPPLYKVASFEMTFDDLLAAVAGTRKPVIVSTGMADEAEIAHALEVLDRHRSGPVTLLHCCSSYPAPPEAINLAAIGTMRERFARPIGFSDHTIGAVASIAAVAMGAVAIEKHVTSDMGRAGPDHRFSATPDVMREIATGVRAVEVMRGDGVKRPTETESASKAAGRRSAFALRDLAAGVTIGSGDFRFVRPSAGIAPNDPQGVRGRVVARPVRAGHPITTEDLVP
jgi:N-acetylneuraminate synthase